MAARPERRGLAAAAWRGGIGLSAVLAAANLLIGLSGGLARLGWPLPAAALTDHGAVMVCGFFGTVIALERAVALHRLAGLLVPLAAGLGGVAVWGLGQTPVGAALWVFAGLALAGLYLLAGLTRAWSVHLKVELAAALVWAAGVGAWAMGAPLAAQLAWMAFLVGTIAGERRELMQFVHLSPGARWAFLAMVGAGAAGVALVLAGSATPGLALWWSACAALALWLLRWDIAPRQWRRAGWAGHTGICLTVGYVWLLLAALLGALGLVSPGSALAPMATHALLLGFVFAMVFGHAPIILPALSGLRPVYTRWVRLPIWLLAASLLMRLVARAIDDAGLLAAAGLGHALAIVMFALTMAGAALRGARARGR